MQCYKCLASLEVDAIYPSTLCPKCHAYQHACLACNFYQVGQPNECRIPGTDLVRDKEGKNFCDEFSPKQHLSEDNNQREEAIKRAKKLLGDS